MADDDVHVKFRLRWPWEFTVDVPGPEPVAPPERVETRIFVTARTPWTARWQARRYLAERRRLAKDG